MANAGRRKEKAIKGMCLCLCFILICFFNFEIFHNKLQSSPGDTGERDFESETCAHCSATGCFKPVHFVLCVVEQDNSFKLKYFLGKLYNAILQVRCKGGELDNFDDC